MLKALKGKNDTLEMFFVAVDEIHQKKGLPAILIDQILQMCIDNGVKISKKIYLDTVGPKIKIEGGQWIFVESGKRYKQQEATCSDAVFPSPKYKCTVNNDLDIVRIDYTKDDYQLITYSAVDELGNISNVVVKIKVEIAENDNSGLIAIIISGVVVLVTFSILGVVVYKNNQKKKKLSYI